MLRKETKSLYGYVVSSKLRYNILNQLYSSPSLRQSEIATKLKQKQQNISKAVYDLEKAELIECLTPNKKAWKSYMITTTGKEVIDFAIKLENNISKNKIRKS